MANEKYNRVISLIGKIEVKPKSLACGASGKKLQMVVIGNKALWRWIGHKP